MNTAEVEHKKCGRCGKQLNVREFHRNSRGGYQSYCRSCNNAYRRNRRKHNKRYRDNNYRATKNARKALREELNGIKSATPCKDCAVYYSPWQMQFDHVQGDKLGNIADMVNHGTRNKLFEELKKCELVCANCHADRTYKRNHADMV